MAEEADKSIGNEPAATSVPLTDRTAEEPREVASSEAQPAKLAEETVSDIAPSQAPPSSLDKNPVGATPNSAEINEKSEKTDQEPHPVADAAEGNQTATQADPGPAEPPASSAPVVPEADAPVDKAHAAAEKAEPASEVPAAQDTEEKAAEVVAEEPKLADAVVEAVAHEAPAVAPDVADAPINGESIADVEMKDAPAQPTSQGNDTSPVAGEKRKAEDAVEVDTDVSIKKSLTEAVPAVPTTNGNGTPPAKKVGRPKKDKKAPAPPGRALRKTRSQGPVED